MTLKFGISICSIYRTMQCLYISLSLLPKNTAAISCTVSGPQRHDRQVEAHAETADQQALNAQVDHDLFGDWNLNIVMMFMLLLHFMQHAMRQPCGC
ncbi:hypothetical protein Plhal304r1_c020g0070851 [Plasmopara halstedii]